MEEQPQDPQRWSLFRERLQAMGHALLVARKRAGLSQEKVAEEIGVERKTIGNVESGEEPRLATLDALATLYGLSIDELIGRVTTNVAPELAPIATGGLRAYFRDSHVYVDIRIASRTLKTISTPRALEIKNSIKIAIEKQLNVDCAFMEDEAPTVDADATQSDASRSSTAYRLQSLEEDAEDNLRVARIVKSVDAGLLVLLTAEELPESLRDRLRAALQPPQSDLL